MRHSRKNTKRPLEESDAAYGYLSPEAQEQLVALYQYISVAVSPKIAEYYTESIIVHCEGLQDFPHRGTRRDDVRPGLRIANYKKRAISAFTVGAKWVFIIGIYYGGRDYESALLSDLDE